MPAMIGGAMVAGAAISGAGAYLGNSASASASKQMYKKRYQWQVADLKAAGLNPMLAWQQGAPVPNQPQVENVGAAAAEGGAKVGSAVSAAKLQQAQMTNLAFDSNLKNEQAGAAGAAARASDAAAARDQAIAAKTAQETEKESAGRDYWGPTAAANYRFADAQGRNLNNTADRVAWEVRSAQTEAEKRQALKPIEIEHAGYLRDATKYGLSEKQADAQFWDTFEAWGKSGPAARLAVEAYKAWKGKK